MLVPPAHEYCMRSRELSLLLQRAARRCDALEVR